MECSGAPLNNLYPIISKRRPSSSSAITNSPVYLATLIDRHAFAGRPNPGHLAIADLMLSQAIQTVVTTNVDTLV